MWKCVVFMNFLLFLGNTPVPDENVDVPYQPPPPFTASQDSNRQPRPKPTPTYRKPPPYVPP